MVKRIQATAERFLLIAGVLLLAIFAGGLLYRSVSSRRALEEFDQRAASVVKGDSPAVAELKVDDEVDFRHWSEQRTKAYRESLATTNGPVLAVLSVKELNIRVPVFEGTDEWALNRGVGWIGGTARPGGDGNTGIAGHRDGFFRALKDVAVGSEIELATLRETAIYSVDQIEIVSPSDVSVLRPRAAPSLTLVTCYPFYFFGHAPKRFIVHATLRGRTERNVKAGPASPRAQTQQ